MTLRMEVLVSLKVMGDINFELNKFDMVVVNKASLVSPETFDLMASTFNWLTVCPVVVIAGNKCQQRPLQMVDSRVSASLHLK